MLNAEKYREEILENSNVVSDFSMSKDKHTIKKCLGVCKDCFFHDLGDHCSNIKVKWLLSEYKEPVKLSKLEYGILKHILNHTEYRYIVRSFNNVYVYTHEPINDLVGGIWCVGEGTYEKVSPLKDLFQFVKDGEYDPMLIKDILNNCEVVDYD